MPARAAIASPAGGGRASYTLAMSRFDRDTAVRRTRAGRYEATIDRGWWIVAGPNGGYVGAILMRAMQDACGDRERTARSVTFHFLRPPREGAAEVLTTIERQGRTVSTVSARLEQQGKLMALAVAAFSKDREGPEIVHARMPELAGFDEAVAWDRVPGEGITIHERYELRWASDDRPWGGGDRMRTAARIRLAEPHPLDEALVAAMSDALPPPVFAVLRGRELAGAVPTVDLTVHFFEPLPAPDLAADEPLLAVLHTRVVRAGFLEADCDLWTRSGRLLAQARQLAGAGS